MFNFADMNSQLQNALKKIGNENGHSAPKSQDPLDQKLHEYYVAKLGEKYFEDRAKSALRDMTTSLDASVIKTIDDIIAATKKNDAGESAVVAGGQHYVLDFSTRKGAKRVDTTALKNALQVKHGLPASVVDKLFDDCSKSNEPSKIYSVKPVRD